MAERQLTFERAADCGLVELLINGAAGIYVPQEWAETCNPANWRGVSREDIDILRASPDHEQYWDTWADVLRDAEWHMYKKRSNGEAGCGPHDFQCWRLFQDGDLWAVCVQDGQTDIVIDEDVCCE